MKNNAFTQSLTCACSDAEDTWMRYIHVLEGVAYATDGHRLHYAPSDLDAGGYSAEAIKHDTDGRQAKDCAALLRRTRSLSGAREREVELPELQDVRDALEQRPRGTILVIADRPYLTWQISYARKRKAKRLRHLCALWEDAPSWKGPPVNAEYLADALVHVGAFGEHEKAVVRTSTDPIEIVNGDLGALVMPIHN